MTGTKTRRLAQRCMVETYQGKQKLSNGWAEAGEEVKDFGTNGYRTRFVPEQYYHDQTHDMLDAGDRDAADRLMRVFNGAGIEEVYGSIFAD